MWSAIQYNTTPSSAGRKGFHPVNHTWGWVTLDWQANRATWLNDDPRKTTCEASNAMNCLALKKAGKVRRCTIYHVSRAALHGCTPLHPPLAPPACTCSPPPLSRASCAGVGAFAWVPINVSHCGCTVSLQAANDQPSFPGLTVFLSLPLPSQRYKEHGTGVGVA